MRGDGRRARRHHPGRAEPALERVLLHELGDERLSRGLAAEDEGDDEDEEDEEDEEEEDEEEEEEAPPKKKAKKD